MPLGRLMSHVWSVIRYSARRPGHIGKEVEGRPKSCARVVVGKGL